MKQILYIMMFKETDYLKIGITKDLMKRIKDICRDIQKEIDLHQSYIIEADRDQDIRPLEKYLHRLTIDDKFIFNSKNNIRGKDEFRDRECLKKVLTFIQDQEKYGQQYNVHKGIDLSQCYNHKIPKAYYPPDIINDQEISKTLANDIEAYCNKSNIDFIQLI